MEDEEGVLRPKEGSYGASNKSAIVKGKRTKRQRSQFPFLFEVNNVSDGDQGCGWEKYGGAKFSPERIEEDSVDREEEDMARCLILLAQGRSRDLGKEVVGYRRRPNYDRQELLDQEDQKFNTKRYLEAGAGTGLGKIGYYEYECKTCSRTFPSFQALGGHRASHYKKPKAAVAEEKKQTIPPLSMIDKDDDEAPVTQFTGDGNEGLPSSVLYLQLSSLRNLCGARGKYNNNNNPKVHECGICGVEFSSGQALGGHMRRHRPPTSASLGFSSTPATTTDSEGPPMRVRNLVSLDLDLNLPAPEAAVDRNDIQEESNSAPIAAPQPKQQQGQQDQPRLVFSVPALVGCHY